MDVARSGSWVPACCLQQDPLMSVFGVLGRKEVKRQNNETDTKFTLRRLNRTCWFRGDYQFSENVGTF